MNQIVITKVVTRNFLLDLFARVQNFFGVNIVSYEKMIAKGVEQIKEELLDRGVELEWFRYEITQLIDGAVAIMLYGEEK